MTNNILRKLSLLVIILCQNWQFRDPNCIANNETDIFCQNTQSLSLTKQNLSISAKKLPNWQLLVQFWPQNCHFLLFIIRKQIQFLFVIREQ